MTPRILRLGLAVIFAALAPAAAASPKVVVIGFDGADAAVTERLMAEGRLPNLKALADEGTYRPLLPTNPPQTPVSWSTFATGLNPGRTEIFDFIKKQGRSYAPALCAFEESRTKFLFGEDNRWAFAGLAALVAFVPLVFAAKFPARRAALLGVAALVALVLGAAGWAFGAKLLPETRPLAVNNRKGATFWELAVQAGLTARVIRVPVTFPTDTLPGLTMISGLGVPDVRGLNGQPTLYTTREGLSGGQFAVSIVPIPDAAASTWDLDVQGPRNLLFPPKDGVLRPGETSRDAGTLTCRACGASVRVDDAAVVPACPCGSGEYDPPRLVVPMRLEAEPDGTVTVTCGDATSRLAPREWSGWHVVEFRFNPILKLAGMARFYNQSAPADASGERRVELVMSPIHPHPDAGGRLGFCHPGDHASDMAEEIGLFKTMGWSIDTWTVSEGLTSDRMCLEDALFTIGGMEKLLLAEMARGSTEDLYVQVFSFTDRIQHIFWRLTDPAHPMYDAALAAEFATVIEDAYVRMDEIVGETRRILPEGTAFFVLSDHGFASFRRGLNTNRWLVNHGFMALKEDPCATGEGGGKSLDDLFEDTSGAFSEVDWSRTRAYAMGLGNVYVNLAGREDQGIVRPGAEYEQLLAEIEAGLEALVDPATGERPVARVWRRDESYRGYDPELIPDLRVANTHGYRVSWDTVLGGIPCQEIVDNDKAWGADHCSLEPELVKGILFSNLELAAPSPEMADMAPTILTALGVPVPAGLDGRSLL